MSNIVHFKARETREAGVIHWYTVDGEEYGVILDEHRNKAVGILDSDGCPVEVNWEPIAFTIETAAITLVALETLMYSPGGCGLYGHTFEAAEPCVLRALVAAANKQPRALTQALSDCDEGDALDFGRLIGCMPADMQDRMYETLAAVGRNKYEDKVTTLLDMYGVNYICVLFADTYDTVILWDRLPESVDIEGVSDLVREITGLGY